MEHFAGAADGPTSLSRTVVHFHAGRIACLIRGEIVTRRTSNGQRANYK
jgi:hypothetical protein